MAKVLLDACVPIWLAQVEGLEVETARQAGLDELSDGELLNALEGRYDVLVTRDRNLVYQQRLADRKIAIVVLRVLRQTPDAFMQQMPALLRAIEQARPAHVEVLPSIRIPRRFSIDGTTPAVTQRVRPNHRAEIRRYGWWDRGGCRIGLG